MTSITFPAALLLAAGDWSWLEDWVFGLGIALQALFVLVYRIVGEEKMLVNQLEGYTPYQEAVRYRLIPYIW